MKAKAALFPMLIILFLGVCFFASPEYAGAGTPEGTICLLDNFGETWFLDFGNYISGINFDIHGFLQSFTPCNGTFIQPVSGTATFDGNTNTFVLGVWSIANGPGCESLSWQAVIDAFTFQTLSGSFLSQAGGFGGAFNLTEISCPQNNVLPVTVDGSLCSNNSYLNKPCVSVTVCTPGTSTCQRINDILVDTGSSGLRIFKQALTISLPQVAAGSGSLADCIQFGDGSSMWGPVQTASVILGNEPAVQIPIQVIDSTFGALPAACQNADKNPTAAGFNGILGIGFFIPDCGSACTTSVNNGIYYSCSGLKCSGTTVALSSQVQNPVALLPQDNNGVIVQLPSVPLDGLPSVNGSLVLGIGTQSNNAPSGVTAYAANQLGEFITNFNGIYFNSFIDTGSNGLFFRSPSLSLLPNCSFPFSAWFCPSSTTSLSATNISAFGSPSGVVSFQIGNFVSLISSSNKVFSDIGGNLPTLFDWGLPFHLGRNVFVGFEGRSSSLGIGPYWAY
jgi:hypothetical protein